MKLSILFVAMVCLAVGCNDSGSKTKIEEHDNNATTRQDSPSEPSPKGIGEIKHVDLNDPLNPDMVNRGKGIYEMKCAACHKLTDQRVVGPGWKGLTERRTPEWIMNMTTNVDVMLAEDPVAQELLKECLVRMPNQNLSIGDARDVLEFAYANDGKPVGQE